VIRAAGTGVELAEMRVGFPSFSASAAWVKCASWRAATNTLIIAAAMWLSWRPHNSRLAGRTARP
jgi:hypothetical protein